MTDDSRLPRREARPAHHQQPNETDTLCVGAWTPPGPGGNPPPYINATMIRMKGDLILTVRLPHPAYMVQGEASCVRFTRETWRAFLELLPEITRRYEAADFLDSH